MGTATVIADVDVSAGMSGAPAYIKILAGVFAGKRGGSEGGGGKERRDVTGERLWDVASGSGYGVFGFRGGDVEGTGGGGVKAGTADCAG